MLDQFAIFRNVVNRGKQLAWESNKAYLCIPSVNPHTTRY